MPFSSHTPRLGQVSAQQSLRGDSPLLEITKVAGTGIGHLDPYPVIRRLTYFPWGYLGQQQLAWCSVQKPGVAVDGNSPGAAAKRQSLLSMPIRLPCALMNLPRAPRQRANGPPPKFDSMSRARHNFADLRASCRQGRGESQGDRRGRAILLLELGNKLPLTDPFPIVSEESCISDHRCVVNNHF